MGLPVLTAPPVGLPVAAAVGAEVDTSGTSTVGLPVAPVVGPLVAIEDMVGGLVVLEDVGASVGDEVSRTRRNVTSSDAPVAGNNIGSALMVKDSPLPMESVKFPSAKIVPSSSSPLREKGASKSIRYKVNSLFVPGTEKFVYQSTEVN